MDLREECLGAKKIGISGHIRPDGDCVGVCLSLQMYLRKLLPEAEVTVYLQKPSEEFSYLKGYDEIQTECPVQEPFDVYFALDCSGDRLGDAETYFQNAKKKINIDHHISNSGCGDVNLVRPEVGSACEVLYHIMDAELIDKDIAEALYTGIIHDTGVFQYSNTTPETLQAAAFLISFGFNFPKLIEESFYQKTYLQTQNHGQSSDGEHSFHGRTLHREHGGPQDHGILQCGTGRSGRHCEPVAQYQGRGLCDFHV